MAWQWDLDHDGAFDGAADKSGKVVEWSISQEGVYPITLRVTSSNGSSDTEALTIDTTNDPPVPHIDAPTGSLHWSVGDEVPFSGSATDQEDGNLAPAALDWSVVVLHCVESTCHEHPLNTLTAWRPARSGPDHEYPSHLELRLTATDSHGTSATTSIELQPATTTLGVASVPAGVPIAVGGVEAQAPTQTTLIHGGTTSVSAPAVWTHGASATGSAPGTMPSGRRTTSR